MGELNVTGATSGVCVRCLAEKRHAVNNQKEYFAGKLVPAALALRDCSQGVLLVAEPAGCRREDRPNRVNKGCVSSHDDSPSCVSSLSE